MSRLEGTLRFLCPSLPTPWRQESGTLCLVVIVGRAPPQSQRMPGLSPWQRLLLRSRHGGKGQPLPRRCCPGEEVWAACPPTRLCHSILLYKGPTIPRAGLEGRVLGRGVGREISTDVAPISAPLGRTASPTPAPSPHWGLHWGCLCTYLRGPSLPRPPEEPSLPPLCLALPLAPPWGSQQPG